MKTEDRHNPVISHIIHQVVPCQTGAFSRGVLLLLLGCLMVWAVPAQSKQVGIGGKRGVDVMQINLYIGGDPERILTVNPSDTNYVEELVAAVTGVYYEIVASQPAVRIGGVADAIADRMPDLVSVEEGTLLRNQSPGDLITGGSTPATNVVYDYVQMLVDALQARGAHYEVASTCDEWDVELPMLNLQTGTIDDIRQTDREAILVRSDLPPGQLRVFHPQSGNFQNVIEFPTLGLSFTRGWCSVDVFCRGREFRYICSHLEQEIAPPIQVLQVMELLNGPANTTMPVMIAGDFNSDPLNRDGSGGLAYDTFINAGFGDAWAVTHPNDVTGGLTWGHDEYLANPSVAFDRRIDCVFYKGTTFMPENSEVLDLWLNRTSPPLWASDHAALSAGFLLK